MFRLIPAACIVVTFSLFAQGPSSQMPTDTEQELRRALQAWRDFGDRADVESRKQMLAETYFQVDVWGKTLDKTGWIEGYYRGIATKMKSGALKSKVTQEAEDRRIYGNAAIVNGRIRVESEEDGAAHTSSQQNTSVWVRENGYWKRALFHNTYIGGQKNASHQSDRPSALEDFRDPEPPVSPTAKDALDVDAAVTAALINKNTATLASLCSDDYTDTDDSGQVRGKHDLLGSIRSGTTEYDSVTDTKGRIRVYDNVIAVSSRRILRGKFTGREISGEFQDTRIYVSLRGSWKLAASQLTRLSTFDRRHN